MDSDTSLDSGVLLSDKSVLLFIVDLNKKYELEVSNAAGLMNTPHTIFSKIFTLCIPVIVQFPTTSRPVSLHMLHVHVIMCTCLVKCHVVESSPQSCV